MDKIKASQFADLAYYCKFNPRSQYQMVEYLKSTGTQWIDTGIVPRETDYVFVDYQLTNIVDSDGTLFYIDDGAVGINSYGLSTANYGGLNTGYVLGWGRDLITNGPTYTLNTSRHTFGLCNGVFEYDETVWETLPYSFVSGKKIYLPAWNRSGTPVIGGKTKIFQFSVFPSRNSTNAIIDLLPCYRKADNKPGFYDRVSGNFFVNIGTGEFAVGGTV